MIQAELAEPPLQKGIGPEIAQGVIFCKVLFFRFLMYGQGFLGLFKNGYMALSKHTLKLKKFFIRLLMFKGGYFHQTPRLGLAAVMSTTFFSVVALPVSQPLQGDGDLTAILSRTEVSAAMQEPVLTNSSRTTQSEVTKDLRSEVSKHVVQSGETLGTIAEEYLVSVEAIQYVNELSPNATIRPGQELTIPPVDGLIHQIANGETVMSIASMYKVPPQALVDFNHLDEPYILHQGNDLIIPNAQVPQKPAPVPQVLAARPAAGLALQTVQVPSGGGSFVMPTGGLITQHFSAYHPAIDVAGGCGVPIVAAESGSIYFAQWWSGGGGNSIMIDHGNGFITKYAHLSSFARSSGYVNKGEVIGYQGATGRAYGCHLHFIVQQNERFVNPLSVM